VQDEATSKQDRMHRTMDTWS